MGLLAALSALAALCTAAARWTPTIPFSKIADEIRDAEKEATELEWKVSNSSAEKDEVKWLMTTAMKELANLHKVVMNSSVKGSLGFKYESCLNRTGRKMPTYNQSLTLDEAVLQDEKLAPGMMEAHMFELYTAQEKAKKLTEDLGACTARCPPSSLLSKKIFAAKKSTRKAFRGLAKAPAPAPAAPAPAGGAAAPAADPHAVMRGVADAIYNTSASMDMMKMALKKDDAAKEVLDKVTGTVMWKLMKAKEDMEHMQQDLEGCLHAPDATSLGDHVQEAMASNSDMTMELLNSAEAQTKEANDSVAALEAKVAECNTKCP